MSVADFLFELGCEELPSGSVKPLSQAFAEQMLSSIDKAGLSHGEVNIFATPRRIALMVKDLASEQASKSVQRRGPALSAAYQDNGQPTQALLGFAKSCGVEPEALTTLKTEKGEWLVYDSVQEGQKTKDLLPEFITQSLKALPISKPMRWGNETIEFVRPVHWAVLLYGKDVIETSIMGLMTGRASKGHRFHHPDAISIESPSRYEAQLEQAFVVADFSKRRERMVEQIQELAKNQQATAIMPDDLLDEVCSIVEWPNALMAGFDKDFLQVPQEALIASMQSHQKCFALTDSQAKLLPYFITVSNIKSLDPQMVIHGNEKVMRARLSDAAFFFHQDKKQPLSSHCKATEKVIFQVKLGSLQDKANRIQALMTHLLHPLKLSEAQVEKAAMLSKCDLMTGMVGEFPELQGLMGYYYALNDQEDQAVAIALNEQYMPRFSGDELPQTDLGLALSLADRFDTLTGIFAIGQKPSGVKDPFKLRRHALAIARMLISTPAQLQLTTLIDEALESFREQLKLQDGLSAEIKHFILERVQAYYLGQGYAVEFIQAVRQCQDEWLYDFEQRLLALKSFSTLPEAASLSAACKRVNNILNGTQLETGEVSEALLEEAAEKALYKQLTKTADELKQHYISADYMTILNQLASLREPVDQFFDQVMVMVDEPALKNNRLNLLKTLQSMLMGVADISVLQL